jgi:urate oxidase
MIALGQVSYGKSAVRLVKVSRQPDRHDMRDVNVDIALEGDFDASYTAGDNTRMLATDSMRNTVYALAKDHLLDNVEEFGMVLTEHFVGEIPSVRRARVRLVEYLWQRIEVDGLPHEHSFTRAPGERTATVTRSAGELHVESGINDLQLLKTTNSGWEDFYREQYTTLPDAHDRILATSLTATWSYHDLSSIQFGSLWQGIRDQILATFTDHYSPSVQNTLFRMGSAVLERFTEVQRIHVALPNKHHLLFDLGRFGLANDNEIFQVTTEPYGLIEGTIERQ